MRWILNLLLVVFYATSVNPLPSAYQQHLRNSDKPESSKFKRSLSDTLGLSTELGSFAISALETFYELQERSKAKVLLKINNLSKWPLGNTQIRVLAGETTNAPNVVFPGYTESIAANQVGSRDRYTEGYAAFDAVPGLYCIFYWYIEGSAKVRKQGNSLGVGCKLSSQTLESRNVLANIDSDILSNEYMTFGDFTVGSQDSIRFCTADICILAIAGSSHQVEANIDILPKRVGNLASTLVDEVANGISQQQLDNLLDSDNCNIGCPTTTEPVVIDSIFNTKKLFKLSTHGDRAGFVIMMLYAIAGVIIALTVLCNMLCE